MLSQTSMRSSKIQPVPMPAHGLYVLESHHADDFHMEAGVWPFHKLGWIAAGRGILEHGSRRRPLHTGELLFVPADMPHRFIDEEEAPMTLVMACFEEQVLGATDAGKALQEEFLALAPPPQVFRMAQYLRLRVQEDLRTMLVEQRLRKTGWEMATLAVFTQLMVYLTRMLPLRDLDNPHDHFQLTVAYIEENFYRKISTADLAAMCDVSERTYSGMFKQRMGTTVTDHLLQYRIAYAKERLQDTRDIAYAAFESGFSDIAHFYRMFKRHTGMTPGAYRSGLAKSD